MTDLQRPASLCAVHESSAVPSMSMCNRADKELGCAGTLPEWPSPNMWTFRAFNNYLSGSLPASWSAWSQLAILDMPFNQVCPSCQHILSALRL